MYHRCQVLWTFVVNTSPHLKSQASAYNVGTKCVGTSQTKRGAPTINRSQRRFTKTFKVNIRSGMLMDS